MPPLLKIVPPDAPAARTVSAIVVVPSLSIAPPVGAELPLIVLLVTVRFASLSMPPPETKAALFSLMVLLITVSVPPPSFLIPPPTAKAALPLIVLFVTVAVPPKEKMPPPKPTQGGPTACAVLPLIVVSITISRALVL